MTVRWTFALGPAFRPLATTIPTGLLVLCVVLMVCSLVSVDVMSALCHPFHVA